MSQRKRTDVEFNMGKVLRVEERFKSTHVRGAGKDAVMGEVSIGHFVLLDNGTSLGFGELVPDCQPGDSLVISFRRVLP